MTDSKMSLSAVSTGRLQSPLRLGFYGPGGVGKTSIAAGAPNAIILPIEKGSDQLACFGRFPRPESWEDILAAIDVLRREKNDYKTLVIDTVDAAEPLCWEYVSRQAGKADIEAFGYGKGYNAAGDEWRKLLARLEDLQYSRGTNIIILAHSAVTKFSNPTGDDFDAYSLRLHKLAAARMIDWLEVLGFFTHDDLVKKNDAGKSVGVSLGRRVLRLHHSAGYAAKTRFDLPAEIVLPSADESWSAFQAELDVAQMAAPALRAELDKIAATNAKVAAWLKTASAATAPERTLRAAYRAARR